MHPSPLTLPRRVTAMASLASLAAAAVLLGAALHAPPAEAASLHSGAQVIGYTMIYDSGMLEANLLDTQSDPAAQRNSSVHALTGTDNSFVGIASARASAGLGWLRAESSVEAATAANAHSSYSAIAYSHWDDSFTLTTQDPLLAGTAGTLRVRIDTHGGLLGNVGFAGYASAFATVELLAEDLAGAMQSTSRSQSLDFSNGAPVLGGDPSLNFVVDLPFIWNRPFELSLTLTASSSAAGYEGLTGSSGNAAARYGNTSTWQGVLGVWDAQGRAVTAFGLASASGMDYLLPIAAPPVPELPTAWMLAAGLGWLLVRRRHSLR